jgi:hypothetical protein
LGYSVAAKRHNFASPERVRLWLQLQGGTLNVKRKAPGIEEHAHTKELEVVLGKRPKLRLRFISCSVYPAGWNCGDGHSSWSKVA